MTELFPFVGISTGSFCGERIADFGGGGGIVGGFGGMCVVGGGGMVLVQLGVYVGYLLK